ncbi:MAG: hypothetical protein U1A78_39170 [Polyangia bacterium]
MQPEALSQLSGTRSIEPFGARTPMIVPSFSSRGFPAVQGLFHALRLDLYGSCLLSAFDLARGTIQTDLLKAADLILLDSGLYEVRSDCDDELHGSPPASGTWSRSEFRSWLTGLPSSVDAVVVSYDQYGPLAEQLSAAAGDFSCCQRAAGDFLMKPEASGQYLSPVLPDSMDLSALAILGVTEKELGSSPQQRCANLMRLRLALRASGRDLPIHVFGAITPRAVLAYFLCGADIFDGLNWLRYDFSGDFIRPLAELPEDPAEWGQTVADRLLWTWQRNLRALQRLQASLRAFAATRDLAALCRALPWAESVLRGVDEAWRTLEEVP